MGIRPAYFALARFYDLCMEVDYEEWASYLLALAGRHTHQPRRLLDLGCGTGSLTLLLAKRGLEVTGVDVSPEMVEIAKNKTITQGIQIPFFVQDMSRLELSGRRFDTVLSSCDVLNYLLTPAQLWRTTGHVSRLLEPRGLWLFDLNSARKLWEIYGNQSYADLGSDFAYFWENSYDPKRQICTMELTFFVEEAGGQYQRITERHRQKLWLPGQMKRIGERHGLEMLACYRFLTTARCGWEDERWQFVMQKKV